MARDMKTAVKQSRRRVVYPRDGFACWRCGLQFPHLGPAYDGVTVPWLVIGGQVVQLQLDHVIPRAAGGTNAVDNLRACCAPCNRRKSAATTFAPWPARIARAQHLLSTRPPTAATAAAAAAALLGDDY